MRSVWLTKDFEAANIPNGAVLTRSAGTAEDARERLWIEREVKLFRTSDRKLFEAMNFSRTAPLIVEPPTKGEEPEAAIGDLIITGTLPGDDPDWRSHFAFFDVRPARFIHATSGGKRIACIGVP